VRIPTKMQIKSVFSCTDTIAISIQDFLAEHIVRKKQMSSNSVVVELKSMLALINRNKDIYVTITDLDLEADLDLEGEYIVTLTLVYRHIINNTTKETLLFYSGNHFKEARGFYVGKFLDIKKEIGRIIKNVDTTNSELLTPAANEEDKIVIPKSLQCSIDLSDIKVRNKYESYLLLITPEILKRLLVIKEMRNKRNEPCRGIYDRIANLILKTSCSENKVIVVDKNTCYDNKRLPNEP